MDQQKFELAATLMNELKGVEGDANVTALCEIWDEVERSRRMGETLLTDLRAGSGGDPLKALRGATFLLVAISIALTDLGGKEDCEINGLVSEAIRDARSFLGTDVTDMFVGAVLPNQFDFEDGTQDSLVARFRKNLMDSQVGTDDLKAVAEDPLPRLVLDFSAALYEKVMEAGEKRAARGLDPDGWQKDDWQEHLHQAIRGHLEKGDPRDVAAYCMFAWYHGWSTALTPTNAKEVSHDNQPSS